MKNIDISKITTNSNILPKKATMFDATKVSYEKFLTQIEGSDFKTAYTRYLTEFNFLEKMLEYAKQEQRKIDIKPIEARINEVTKILKEQKGIIK